MATNWDNFRFCAQAVGAAALPLLAPLGLYLQAELASRPQTATVIQQPQRAAAAVQRPASEASATTAVLKL